MDSALKDLGQTLAVGVFTIFGAVYLIIMGKPSWKERIFVLLNNSHKFYQAGMSLALVFAAGVLIEDVSKNFAAERVDEPISATIFNYVVDTDKELRLRSLLFVHYSSNYYIEFSPAPAYKSIMAVNTKNLRFIRNKNILTNIPLLPCVYEKKESCTRVEGEKEIKLQADAINQIYYDAKNRVYKENTYFIELLEIEKRVNFARSLTFLCLIYSFLVFVLVILCWLPHKWKVIPTLRKKRKFIIFRGYAVGISE